MLGIIGILLFGSCLYFTFSIPGYVENVGKDFIISQIQKKTGEKIDAFKLQSQDSKLAQIAGKLYRGHQTEMDYLKNQLKNHAHDKLASVVAEMRNLDCECRKKYAQMLKDGFEFRLVSLQKAADILQDFMKAKYMEVATELKMDIRIFTASNALIFLLLLVTSFLKPRAIVHLFLPGVLLATAAFICSYLYIFEQNWLLTIIYSDYLGFAYLGYVGVVFLFLCDIVFNRARVTSEIINALLDAVGSAVSVGPC
jgi:hypothetical protein